MKWAMPLLVIFMPVMLFALSAHSEAPAGTATAVFAVS